jgi:hypothetical protein
MRLTTDKSIRAVDVPDKPISQSHFLDYLQEKILWQPGLEVRLANAAQV